MTTWDIIDFAALDVNIQELIRKSTAVRERSYSPYSKFKVGAAILCADGTIYTGCNIENASFPVGLCAERAVIAKAISEGKKEFKALAVVADLENGSFTSPCGMCRQGIAEFGDMPIYLTRSDMKSVARTTVTDLLPFSFALLNGQALQ